ncbi:hypothetical protein [Bradyrhizobium cenepequi]|uniref:hypothetical protein n=1 Tax=Bradyrhizobium cenepequi TaxID=2821403 RepID=UPI001CE26BE3|nr:hypothetical protein [Bradyrhizobium cenepequi]MCA6108297.1 hypothetical protein [Bradyrhizobium cenepequi]
MAGRGILSENLKLLAEFQKGRLGRSRLVDRFLYKNYAFEQWFSFLESFVLVARTLEGQIAITPRGRRFLRYIIETRLYDTEGGLSAGFTSPLLLLAHARGSGPKKHRSVFRRVYLPRNSIPG